MLSKVKAFFKKISPPWHSAGWPQDEAWFRPTILTQEWVDKNCNESDDNGPEVIGPPSECCGVEDCKVCKLQAEVDDKEFYELIDPKGHRVEIYRDKKKEWRWRLLSKNNKVIACSGEGYKRRAAMRKSLNIVREVIPFCPVTDETK